MTTDAIPARSKKQSDANSNSKLLDKLEIFIDRSLGKKIALPLELAGAIVHLHDDHFAQNVEDQVWLSAVGKQGWLVLTKDQRIRRRPLERDALMNANLKVFCFMSGNISFAEMADIIAKALPAVKNLADNTSPPFIAGIYKDSRVKTLLTT
ncbi:MAG: hypothetical protein HOP17_17875 [Acidobacteria bacterium]|nr:hypothetical protein [Acidobacteriota bacterium]